MIIALTRTDLLLSISPPRGRVPYPAQPSSPRKLPPTPPNPPPRQVFPGSDAALAQATQAGKDQPDSPMHKVAERGERVRAAPSAGPPAAWRPWQNGPAELEWCVQHWVLPVAPQSRAAGCPQGNQPALHACAVLSRRRRLPTPRALRPAVAAAVREKVEAAEERFAHPHTFVGPNPDEGSEGAK